MQVLMAVLDTDNSGGVSKEELAQWAREYDQKYKEWDGDNTPPLLSLLNPRKDKLSNEEKEAFESGWDHGEMNAVFELFDDNSNGLLDRQEVAAFMREIYDVKGGITAKQINQVIAYCDEDHDGAISKEEFMAYAY